MEKEEEKFYKTTVRTLQTTQAKVNFLATKFGKNKQTPPRKFYPAEKPKNNKNERDPSILTFLGSKDAEKIKINLTIAWEPKQTKR